MKIFPKNSVINFIEEQFGQLLSEKQIYIKNYFFDAKCFGNEIVNLENKKINLEIIKDRDDIRCDIFSNGREKISINQLYAFFSGKSATLNESIQYFCQNFDLILKELPNKYDEILNTINSNNQDWRQATFKT